jgi:hypothetical protein
MGNHGEEQIFPTLSAAPLEILDRLHRHQGAGGYVDPGFSVMEKRVGEGDEAPYQLSPSQF